MPRSPPPIRGPRRPSRSKPSCPADSIPFVYLERPYYVAPINRGAKVYALLRETLQRTGRVGVARVVIQTKQHLAVLVPSGPGLVLNLLRWGADIRPWKDLPLPPQAPRPRACRSASSRWPASWSRT